LFNPLWTKFMVDRKEDIGITDMKLRSEGNEFNRLFLCKTILGARNGW